MLCFFFDLLQVVQTFQPVAAFQPLLHFENIAHQLMVFCCRADLSFADRLFNRAECFHYENGMMRNNGTAAFANDCWMRDAFGVAHVHDVPDDIVRVFLQGIVR